MLATVSVVTICHRKVGLLIHLSLLSRKLRHREVRELVRDHVTKRDVKCETQEAGPERCLTEGKPVAWRGAKREGGSENLF